MVLFNLKKDAGQVRQLMANSLVDICRASFKYDTELNIEGMLCITLDKQDVLPIPVNIQLQKKTKACPNTELNTSLTQTAAINSKDRNSHVARGNAALEMNSDLQSAQAVLQSLLAKTPTSQTPEFIPLGDMSNLTDSVSRDGLSSQAPIKLEGVSEESNDVDMDEGDDLDEGIHVSQDSTHQKTPTLQDAVGSVIKSFYQESSSAAGPMQSTDPLAAVTASQGLNSPLTVIKVIQPSTAGAAATSTSMSLTAQQKLSNSLPWKREAPKKFQCPMCSYTSDRRFCINRHMKLHVGRAGVQCQICHNIFADHWYLTKVHMPKHHPESVGNGNSPGSSNSQTASSAQDTGRSSNSLTAKECNIKCPVCPFLASSAISFRNHLNTHSRDCLKCGLRFLTPADVQQHVQQQHGDDVDLSECIYDPDMADNIEDDALRNAVHLTPTNTVRSTTVVGDSEGVGAEKSQHLQQQQQQQLEPSQQDGRPGPEDEEGLGMPTEGELEQATALYTQEVDGEQVPLLHCHNYMMVVNESNQVEIHGADGTVVEGIVSEDGQVYTTQEVAVEQLIKKEGEVNQEEGIGISNGDATELDRGQQIVTHAP